mgnify:CR=1 FL=1
MTWHKLCNKYPEEDEPIALKANNKTYFGIRVIDERGDMIHCQERENGDFVFSINLLAPFNDESFEWRKFDD